MMKDLARHLIIDPNNVCVKYLKFGFDGDKIKAQFKGTQSVREDFNNDLLDGELPSSFS